MKSDYIKVMVELEKLSSTIRNRRLTKLMVVFNNRNIDDVKILKAKDRLIETKNKAIKVMSELDDCIYEYEILLDIE